MTTVTSPRGQSPANTPRVKSPSIADTPTSPARPSVETTSQTPNPTKSQRRNRAALRDYYNLKSKSGPVEATAEGLTRAASTTSIASDTTNTSATTLPADTASVSTLTAQLDDPTFDPEAWVSDLLKSCSLRDILRTEATLVSEVRNLDGERKALVYDNYSKLIKAVGTIAEMQRGMRRADAGGRGGLDGVDALNSQLEDLSVSAKDLASSRGADGADRSENRKKRELVKWVLTAPDRLRKLVAEGKKDEARKQWATVQALLKTWKDVPGSDDVRYACSSIMSTI